MPEPDDHSLLQEFAHGGSEAAFAVLVERYVNLVYSTALRSTGNPNDAEEITQAVFIILARKAGKLSTRIVLSGWLYQATRLTAANFKKGEGRRQRREQEAYMQSTLNESNPAAWAQFAPLLDEAMDRLGETDRTAIVLHYFEKKTAAEVAVALRTTEAAVYKRTHRALEKLKLFFAKRGVDSTASSIAETISIHSIQVAPATLAKSVTALAVTKGATASVSTLTLIKGALKIMAWSNAKTAIVAGVTVLITASVAHHIWYYHLTSESWQHRFEATYSLRHGEVLRYIPPPFIPERLTYYQKNAGLQAAAIPSGPDTMILSEDQQGRLNSPSYVFGSSQGPQPNPLRFVLLEALGFKTYEFEGSNNLLDLPLTGDWTIKEGSDQATLVTSLEPILRKATKHNVIFNKQTIPQDVIVVTGHHFAVRPGTSIQLYAENLHDNSYDTYGDLKSLFDDVGNRLELRLINETQMDTQPSDNVSNLTWTLHQDFDFGAMGNRRLELTNKALKNLADQTGLTFTREQRPEDVWVISEQR